MEIKTDGIAIVYCEGEFHTANGKTAHGLVRYTKRYNVLCVIDSKNSGKNASEMMNSDNSHIPIVSDLNQALNYAKENKKTATHFVIGLAPDGGRIDNKTRDSIIEAIKLGLNIDCGLHDYLSDDEEVKTLAKKNNVVLRDIRKPKPIKELHSFTGKIEEVQSIIIAVLGTDSAVGKRTTATMLVNSLREEGYKAELIGTGQTAWMQGIKYSIILDSLINDFVAGEIEHVVHSAWENEKPNFIVLEGQGGLLNPAYPGGYELIAAGRPDMIILQHAPSRKYYDGFPGFKLHPLQKQIKAIEIISGKQVVAVTINHENMSPIEVENISRQIIIEHDIPAYDVVLKGSLKLAKHIVNISSRVTEKKIRFRRRVIEKNG